MISDYKSYCSDNRIWYLMIQTRASVNLTLATNLSNVLQVERPKGAMLTGLVKGHL